MGVMSAELPTPPAGAGKKIWLWVLVAAVVATSFVVWQQTVAKATFAVGGTLQLNSSRYELVRSDDTCPLSGGGFADIRHGTPVTVYDSSGKAVALGALGLEAPASKIGEKTSRCYFSFDVSGVPEGDSIYSIEIGHRGRVQFTREALRAVVDLKIGD